MDLVGSTNQNIKPTGNLHYGDPDQDKTRCMLCAPAWMKMAFLLLHDSRPERYRYRFKLKSFGYDIRAPITEVLLPDLNVIFEIYWLKKTAFIFETVSCWFIRNVRFNEYLHRSSVFLLGGTLIGWLGKVQSHPSMTHSSSSPTHTKSEKTISFFFIYEELENCPTINKERQSINQSNKNYSTDHGLIAMTFKLYISRFFQDASEPWLI